MSVRPDGSCAAGGPHWAAMSKRINHVSVNARDLQESVAFYVELLDAEPIPAPR